MPRPRLSPEDRRTLCASLRSRNACPHVTRDIRRATLYRNLQEKCSGPDWAQNADTHFVRACAVKMHVHMSQGTSEEPRYTGIYRKNAAAQNVPRTRTNTYVRACEVETHVHVSQDIRKATLYGNLQEKCRGPDWAQNADEHFVRACAVETHVKMSQEPIYTEIYR